MLCCSFFGTFKCTLICVRSSTRSTRSRDERVDQIAIGHWHLFVDTLPDARRRVPGSFVGHGNALGVAQIYRMAAAIRHVKNTRYLLIYFAAANVYFYFRGAKDKTLRRTFLPGRYEKSEISRHFSFLLLSSHDRHRQTAAEYARRRAIVENRSRCRPAQLLRSLITAAGCPGYRSRDEFHLLTQLNPSVVVVMQK